MYCRKCGKFVDYEGDICKECARVETVSEDVVATENTSNNASPDMGATIVKETYINKGKGMGIAGVIISAVSYIVILVAYFMFIMALVAIEIPGLSNDEIIEAAKNFLSMSSGLIFTCWVGVVMALPSVVFGIVSIVRFIKLKRRGVKSVATLVLGIISLAMGVSAFFSGIMFAGVMEAGDNEIRTALNGVLYSL